MLLEFQVENYMSFKEKARLCMLASSSISKKKLTGALFFADKYRVLKSAAVYGANASGKSNLFKAISFMKDFIFKSARENVFGKGIDVSNFKLSEDTVDKPSTFEMTFIVKNNSKLSNNENIVFRYGFQVDKTSVRTEWLFARFTALESNLFTRIEDNIKIGAYYKEGEKVYKTLGNINKSSLFLSQIALIKGDNAPITSLIMDWFFKITDISEIADHNFFPVTVNLMENVQFKNKVLKAFKLADLCVEDITVKKKNVNYEALSEDEKRVFNETDLKYAYSITLNTIHSVYNQKKKEIGKVAFNFHNEESDGSKKFFAIIGPVIDALENGYVLVIDELDARLHSNLCLLIISLFNSEKVNKYGAQLIFTAHNTLFMDKRNLRRDQIYLVEKDKYGASELYSLLDYVKVRSDASFSKDYLMGKYGAVPYLGNFESLFDEE